MTISIFISFCFGSTFLRALCFPLALSNAMRISTGNWKEESKLLPLWNYKNELWDLGKMKLQPNQTNMWSSLIYFPHSRTQTSVSIILLCQALFLRRISPSIRYINLLPGELFLARTIKMSVPQVDISSGAAAAYAIAFLKPRLMNWNEWNIFLEHEKYSSLHTEIYCSINSARLSDHLTSPFFPVIGPQWMLCYSMLVRKTSRPRAPSKCRRQHYAYILPHGREIFALHEHKSVIIEWRQFIRISVGASGKNPEI